MTIKREKWPAYIRPHDDELLSSWLIRLIREHHINPNSFSSYYFGGYNFMSRDIDKYLPEYLIELIQKFSYLNIDEIKSMQLSFYSNNIFEGNLETNFVQGVSNVGVYHRTKKHNGLLICASCLRKNVYFKKSWRLLSSIICLDCSSYLSDCCPECKSPIDFQRQEIGRDKKNNKLNECWKCGFDFRLIDLPTENQLHLNYQIFVDRTLKNGFNNYTPYSFLYFKVLFLFLQKFKTSTGNWNRIHNALMAEFNLDLKLLNELNYISYHLSPLSIRIEILPLVHSLLEEWPVKFLMFVKKYNIRLSDFTKDEKKSELPFWFLRSFIEI